MKLDKSKWEKVRFGDIAFQQKDCVDIETTNLTRYIAGEHMNSEDVHLRNWGVLGNGYLGPAFIRKFEKGDILYGSRRTYLKKVAVADFDGITSNTTFVIRANEKKIDSRLVPFLMLGDSFTKHSVENSKGSVNPYINWKDIADFEFLLPPKEEQTRLAELLWAADEVVEREKEVKEKLINQYNNLIENNEFSNIPTKLNTLVDINKETIKSNTSPDYQLKYLDIACIIAPKKIGELKEYSFKDAPSRARRIAKKGDLIISLVRPYLKSFVKIDNDISNLIASTGTAVLTAKKDVSIDYIFHQFFSKNFTEFCESRMNGTNYPAITPSDLGDFDVLLPDLDQQELIADQLNSIDGVYNVIDNQIHIIQQLKSSLINQIF